MINNTNLREWLQAIGLKEKHVLSATFTPESVIQRPFVGVLVQHFPVDHKGFRIEEFEGNALRETKIFPVPGLTLEKFREWCEESLERPLKGLVTVAFGRVFPAPANDDLPIMVRVETFAKRDGKVFLDLHDPDKIGHEAAKNVTWVKIDKLPPVDPRASIRLETET